MRDMIFSPTQSRITQEERSKISDAEYKNGNADTKSAREDDIWNKRQLIYGIALLGSLGIVPAIVAFMPQWILFTFAVLWGLGSVGFPLGLFGKSRFETGYSRHMARLVFMGFSLLVIYTMYQYMALVGTSSPSSSPPGAGDVLPPPTATTTHTATHVDMLWTLAFGILGGIVMAGHIFSWVMGCMTGSDRDDESVPWRGESEHFTGILVIKLVT
ncbi:hypothetical protein C2845_PM03G21000 [Panicum miliaceum]|uniref:Uncharacterized protein n=1 Tax=Panicum miliaceum TaxID=4540 RepID=A0A3L6T695_PANMI|nr:hypothetical protein C2845_PM03G21000 [Panicum miliaceum]